MNIRLRQKEPYRRYECFDCGLTLSCRAMLFACPECGATDDWHHMD